MGVYDVAHMTYTEKQTGSIVLPSGRCSLSGDGW